MNKFILIFLTFVLSFSLRADAELEKQIEDMQSQIDSLANDENRIKKSTHIEKENKNGLKFFH